MIHRVRRGPSGPLAAALAFGLAAPLLAAAARPNVEGPLPGHTGGFGEPDCTACHMGPDPDGVVLELEGLPGTWQPGRTYTFDVVVSAETLVRGGFQLSARFPDGTQAGTLEVAAGGAVTASDAGVQYAHHIYDGTAPDVRGTSRWTLAWTAPGGRDDGVTLNVAANAANDDNSEFGDRIITLERTLKPAR